MLNEIAVYEAWIGHVYKKLFMQNAMWDLAATLCQWFARHIIASVPLQARLDCRPVFTGLPVKTDGL